MDATESLATIILNRRSVQVAFLVSVLVLLPVGVFGARRLGWSSPRVLASAGTAVGLSLVAAVTLGRVPGTWQPTSVLACAHDATWVLDTPEAVLNLLLFMPAAFCAVLALERLWPVVVGSLLISCGIEATQALLGLGTCQTSDVVRNAIGGAVAALVARSLLRPGGG